MDSPSVAIFQTANANQNLISKLQTRIANANHSIDACFYSLSGASEGSVLASALIAAKNRGVNVRIICEADNRTSSAFNSIAAAGIPIITDQYDDDSGVRIVFGLRCYLARDHFRICVVISQDE